MPTFLDLGVREDIVTRLAARGVVEPFPIQAATIADALSGRDVCGRAPTGSGKTIAFGIPLVTTVGKAAPREPRGLVLVPTRELANQVASELASIAGPKVRIETVFGGVAYGNQLRALRRGVDILVACPGRLKDLVDRNECRLSSVEFIVLDEADRMADMGFLPEVRRILDQVRSDRQTLLFSATLDGDINTLIQNYQRNPARHEVEEADDAIENTYFFWKTDRNRRVKLVADIVSKEYSSIVFCRTKHGADRLADQLHALDVSSAAIHGDRTQKQRERALAEFTRGKVQCLVATDIAARGIHVDDVGCVIHFDPPADDKDFIHRSGRTGRAGKAGNVYSLMMPDQVRLTEARRRRLDLVAAEGEPEITQVAPRPEPTFVEPVREERKSFEGRKRKPDTDRPKRAWIPDAEFKAKKAEKKRDWVPAEEWAARKAREVRPRDEDRKTFAKRTKSATDWEPREPRKWEDREAVKATRTGGGKAKARTTTSGTKAHRPSGPRSAVASNSTARPPRGQQPGATSRGKKQNTKARSTKRG